MKLFVLVSMLLIAGPAQAAFQRVTGNCTIQHPREIVVLENIDPSTRYGMIAEGFTKGNDRIYLSENFTGSVSIHVQSPNGGGEAIYQLNKAGPTRVRFSIMVGPANISQKDYLTCDLLVKLRR